MPVRGKGWYKRPWRLAWRDPKSGKMKHAEYHSKINAIETQGQYLYYGYADVSLTEVREDEGPR